MIGWYVVIATRTRDERASDEDRKASILASWEVSVEGLGWLDQLVDQGRATKLQGNGYPNLYTAKARDVLELLRDGPPPMTDGMTIIGDDYVMPSGWLSAVEMHQDRMAACPKDQLLSIEAWDLS